MIAQDLWLQSQLPQPVRTIGQNWNVIIQSQLSITIRILVPLRNSKSQNHSTLKYKSTKVWSIIKGTVKITPQTIYLWLMAYIEGQNESFLWLIKGGNVDIQFLGKDSSFKAWHLVTGPYGAFYWHICMLNGNSYFHPTVYKINKMTEKWHSPRLMTCLNPCF